MADDAAEAVELQEEEIETLRAIYDEELSVSGSPGQRELTLAIVTGGSAGGPARLALWVLLPAAYPLDAASMPPYGLTGPLTGALDEDHIFASLSELWAEADGAGVVWPWAEWLREFMEPFLTEPDPEPEPYIHKQSACACDWSTFC